MRRLLLGAALCAELSSSSLGDSWPDLLEKLDPLNWQAANEQMFLKRDTYRRNTAKTHHHHHHDHKTEAPEEDEAEHETEETEKEEGTVEHEDEKEHAEAEHEEEHAAAETAEKDESMTMNQGTVEHDDAHADKEHEEEEHAKEHASHDEHVHHGHHESRVDAPVSGHYSEVDIKHYHEHHKEHGHRRQRRLAGSFVYYQNPKSVPTFRRFQQVPEVSGISAEKIKKGQHQNEGATAMEEAKPKSDGKTTGVSETSVEKGDEAQAPTKEKEDAKAKDEEAAETPEEKHSKYVWHIIYIILFIWLFCCLFCCFCFCIGLLINCCCKPDLDTAPTNTEVDINNTDELVAAGENKTE